MHGDSGCFRCQSELTSCVVGALTHTPLFSWNISCLAPILGESGDSSPGLGFAWEGKIAVISANRERSEGEIFEPSQIRDQG